MLVYKKSAKVCLLNPFVLSSLILKQNLIPVNIAAVLCANHMQICLIILQTNIVLHKGEI